MSADAPGGLRVGQGFDVHRFSDDTSRPLVLGGVDVPGPGLDGHSDADVVCHALCDALLGALALGDIGRHFPADDDRWAGARSLELLRTVRSKIAAAGATPHNADCTVVCEAPRLAPHLPEMERVLSEALGAPVSVKATTAEGLGAIGAGQGIACLAVALVRLGPGAS